MQLVSALLDITAQVAPSTTLPISTVIIPMLESLNLVTMLLKALLNKLSAQRVTTTVIMVEPSVTSAVQVTSAMDWASLNPAKMALQADLSVKLVTIVHPTIPSSLQLLLYQLQLLSSIGRCHALLELTTL